MAHADRSRSPAARTPFVRRRAYNVSSAARADYIAVDSSCHGAGDRLTYLYEGAGSVPVAIAADGTHHVQLHLNGRQFCMLTESSLPGGESRRP